MKMLSRVLIEDSKSYSEDAHARKCAGSFDKYVREGLIAKAKRLVGGNRIINKVTTDTGHDRRHRREIEGLVHEVNKLDGIIPYKDKIDEAKNSTNSNG